MRRIRRLCRASSAARATPHTAPPGARDEELRNPTARTYRTLSHTIMHKDETRDCFRYDRCSRKNPNRTAKHVTCGQVPRPTVQLAHLGQLTVAPSNGRTPCRTRRRYSVARSESMSERDWDFRFRSRSRKARTLHVTESRHGFTHTRMHTRMRSRGLLVCPGSCGLSASPTPISSCPAAHIAPRYD